MLINNKKIEEENSKGVENTINKKLDEIKVQMEELKRMKIQFIKEKQEFDRAVAQAKSNPKQQ